MSKNVSVANPKRGQEETHDEWFRAEVEKTVAGLKDGSVQRISEAEHDRRWREKRKRLLAAGGKLNDEA